MAFVFLPPGVLQFLRLLPGCFRLSPLSGFKRFHLLFLFSVLLIIMNSTYFFGFGLTGLFGCLAWHVVKKLRLHWFLTNKPRALVLLYADSCAGIQVSCVKLVPIHYVGLLFQGLLALGSLNLDNVSVSVVVFLLLARCG